MGEKNRTYCQFDGVRCTYVAGSCAQKRYHALRCTERSSQTSPKTPRVVTTNRGTFLKKRMSLKSPNDTRDTGSAEHSWSVKTTQKHSTTTLLPSSSRCYTIMGYGYLDISCAILECASSKRRSKVHNPLDALQLFVGRSYLHRRKRSREHHSRGSHCCISQRWSRSLRDSNKHKHSATDTNINSEKESGCGGRRGVSSAMCCKLVKRRSRCQTSSTSP